MRALASILCICLTACGGVRDREPLYRAFDGHDFDQARETLPTAGRTARDALLNALDLGSIEQAARRYEASNSAFFEADELFEELFTKSVSRELARWTVSEYARVYAGEDFERVLLHVMLALNFLELGDRNAALVESRAINTRLTAIGEERGSRSTYRSDAFALYLAGLIQDIAGDRIAAWVDYLAAYETYRDLYEPAYGVPAPRALGRSLQHLALELDRPEAGQRLDAELGPAPAKPAGTAEIIVIVGVGSAPRKVEASLTLLTPDDIPVKVAIPRFEPVPIPCSQVVVQVGSKRPRAVLVESVDAIATQDLEDRIAREHLRAGSRSVTKYLAGRKARKEAGALAGFIVGALGAASEEADLRSWRTLPSAFRMARAWVSPGTHSVRVGCGPRWANIGPMDIRAGERVIRYVRIP